MVEGKEKETSKKFVLTIKKKKKICRTKQRKRLMGVNSFFCVCPKYKNKAH